jgi:hypothetical protein
MAVASDIQRFLACLAESGRPLSSEASAYLDEVAIGLKPLADLARHSNEAARCLIGAVSVAAVTLFQHQAEQPEAEAAFATSLLAHAQYVLGYEGQLRRPTSQDVWEVTDELLKAILNRDQVRLEVLFRRLYQLQTVADRMKRIADGMAAAVWTFIP